MNYFIIHNSDGDTTIEELTKEELTERLQPDDEYEGGGYYGDVKFLEKMPVDIDTNYWGNNILIIKGEIVVPEPKDIVTEYQIS